MTEQPEALQIAHSLEAYPDALAKTAAAELRRLHEEVETCGAIIQYHEASIKRMGTLNQELLKALKNISVALREDDVLGHDIELMLAAIARAEGETK